MAAVGASERECGAKAKVQDLRGPRSSLGLGPGLGPDIGHIGH